MKSRVQDCRKCRQQIADEVQKEYLKQGYDFFTDSAYSIAYLIIAAALSVHDRRGRSKAYIRSFYDEMLFVLKIGEVFGKPITMTDVMKHLETEFGIDFDRVELNLESFEEFYKGTKKAIKKRRGNNS